MPIVIDNFTGADGQLLSARPAGWTAFKVFPNNLPFVNANNARFNNNEGTACGVSLDFGNADQDIEITLVDVPAAGFGSNGAIYLRLSYTLNSGALVAASVNALMIRAYGTNSIAIHDLINGAETNGVPATFSGSWAAGDKLRAKITGTSLTVYRNNVAVQSFTGRTHNQTQTIFGIGYPLTGGNWDIADVTDPSDSFGVAASSITLADLTNNRVYQRAAGTDAAAVTLAGSYTGTPGTIEYRIFDVTAGAALADHDWQTLIAAPSGGTFSASRNIASGGPYRIDLRTSAAPATIYSGTAQWLVGDVLLISGQSNADGLRIGTSAVPADAQVRLYDQDDSWKQIFPTYGAGIVALGNRMRSLTGKPVGIIVRAAAATSIGQWQLGGGSLLDQALADMQAATATAAKLSGDIAAFLWCQGEADTGVGTTYNAPAVYQSALDAIYTALKTQTGRTAAHLPFLVAITGRHEGQSGNDSGWQNIRQAQIDWCAATAGAVLSHMTYDLPMADAFHYTAPDGYAEHGRRFGRSAAKAAGAAVYGAEGPKISSATRQGAVITVQVALNGSAALQTSGTGALTGWQVSADDFATLLPVSAISLQGTSQVSVTLATAPAANAALKLRYAWGQDPDTATILVGDAA
jgi:hypothetical protein